MICDPPSSLAVVPIFVNAGSALLPLIAGPVVAFFAILFKPRELAGLLRRKPWVLLILLGIAGGTWLIWPSGNAANTSTARRGERPAIKKDWTAIALTVIRDQAMAHKTSGLKPAWDYNPDDGMVLSTPLVAGGKVIGSAAVQDVGAFIGMLYALDARTGNLVWKVEKVGEESLKPIFSSPALSADGKAFIVGMGLHEDRDCYLVCVDVDSGRLRWKVKTPLHIESSPTVHGDLVVVGAGAIEDAANHKPTSHPGYVLAVRISDGAELWRHDVIDPESSPAIAADGTVYIGSGFNGNAIVALRSETDDQLKSKGLKREIWRVSSKNPVTGPVTLVDDLVIVGGGNGDFVWEDPNPAGFVMALNRKDGSLKWEAKMDAAVLGRIVHHAGKLYCPVRNGQVVALNFADGKPLWKQNVSGKSPILAGLTIERGLLFAVSQDGFLALMDPASGKLIEKHPLNTRKPEAAPTRSYSTPTLAGERLYVGSEAGGLRCFQLLSTNGPGAEQAKSTPNSLEHP